MSQTASQVFYLDAYLPDKLERDIWHGILYSIKHQL
jgi:hypothetical protein